MSTRWHHKALCEYQPCRHCHQHQPKRQHDYRSERFHQVGRFYGADRQFEFASNPFYREFTNKIEITEAAKGIPKMQGSGAVRDLQEAASLDNRMVTVVNGFEGFSKAEMLNQIDTLLNLWSATASGFKTSAQRALEENTKNGMSLETANGVGVVLRFTLALRKNAMSSGFGKSPLGMMF